MPEEKKEFKKIPDIAKCVFKGVLHEVWQWEQEQFDGSFKTFEMIRRNSGVTIISVTTEKEIIINYEEQPHRGEFISVQGGISEDDENLDFAAQRELLEETGYESDNVELWFVNDVLGHSKIEYWNYVYVARDCKKIGEPRLDPGEKIETHFLNFEEFIQISQDPKFRNKEITKIVKEILDNKHELNLQDLKNFLLGE